MSVSAEALRSHIRYTSWASRSLVEVAGLISAEELARDFGTADKSILGTLVHVFAADRIWLARLLAEPHGAYVTEADYQLAVLQKDWPALLCRWEQWAGGLSDEMAGSQISYQDLSGRHWTQPVWQLVLHVVNHGTHHRGQVAGFLRALGRVPPKLDLVHFFRVSD